jgi:hypothetical protein
VIRDLQLPFVKALIKLLFIGILLAILIGPFVLLPLAIDDAPTVTVGAPPKAEDIERLKALLKQNDPRRLREGESRQLTLTERDINLGIEYLCSRVPFAGAAMARTDLGDGHGLVEASVPLPDNPLGRYLNIAAMVAPAERGVTTTAVRVGRVPVPQWLLKRLFAMVEKRAGNVEAYRELMAVADAISAVHFGDDRVSLTFRVERQLAERIEERGRELVLPAEERELLMEHYGKLSQVLSSMGLKEVSLAKVLKPMYAHAAERSQRDNDAAAENRSVLLTLALYVAAREDEVRRLLGEEAAVRLPPMPKVTLTLQSREDLAQHFLVSAALTGAANSAIADAIGVFKEVQDSRGGSGFSFADLAADRAGVRFAHQAGTNPQKWQEKVAAIVEEADFMPGVERFPEGMQEPAFIERFKSRDSEAYALVTAEIERRIDGCAVFR